MKANVNPWFELNGVRNRSMHLEMLSMPTRPLAAKSGVKETVPGRSGFLWQDYGALEADTIRLQAITTDGADPDALGKWLSEGTTLVFSDEPDRAWRVRLLRSTARSHRSPRLSGQELTLVWDCQPYRFAHPAPEPIVLTEGSAIVDNPGTAFSEPVITVYGSGDFSMNVNGVLIDCEGLEDGAVIDCAAMEVFDLNRMQLLNEKFSMDAFPRLEPGGNTVVWSGGISKVEILPGWRYV